ncbi:unnamed protein product [marine sediment metagenome]|uniref:Uncharacterized protein n=1 Tax=marine sediment metagenome TaxID=412755 RepID=X1JQA2_9ZZZZ
MYSENSEFKLNLIASNLYAGIRNKTYHKIFQIGTVLSHFVYYHFNPDQYSTIQD